MQLVAWALPSVEAQAAEVPVECRVLYETPDGLYVDAGSDQGLTEGARGIIEREGGRIGQVEVAQKSKSYALLRVLSGSGPMGPPRAGDTVRIMVEQTARDSKTEEGKNGSPTLKGTQGDDEFVPLLAPPGRRRPGLTEPRNIFHGQIRLSQLFQVDSNSNQDYSITRLGTAGSLERMGGSPWALEWSGDLYYRSGEALENSIDYQKPRLLVYRLALFRPFEDGSFLRVGRLLPRQLPAVGYLDGVQFEKVLSRYFRLGTAAGFKPTRTRLDISVKEPTLAPYVTFEAGKRRSAYYSGTAGLLGSLYDGSPDRLAFLLDQSFELGPRFTAYSTLAVDFDVGSMETRSGVRLTRLNIHGDYVVARLLTLRAGGDHYERLDTQAERDLISFPSDRYFDSGYWRYWIGASHDLPWNLRLSEEVAFITSPDDDDAPHWRVTLTRFGLPAMRQANLTVSIFNLDGSGTNGYGGRLSGYFPLLDHQLSLEAGVGFRFMETRLDSRKFDFGDVSARLNWNISRSWNAYCGFSHAFGTDIAAYLIDLGLMYRW